MEGKLGVGRGEQWRRRPLCFPSVLGACPLASCTRGLLLAQLPGSRAPHRFLMAPQPGRAGGLASSPQALPMPCSGLLLLSSPQCSSWGPAGSVEEGRSLPRGVSPSTAEGPRLSRAPELTPQTGGKLGKASECVRGS